VIGRKVSVYGRQPIMTAWEAMIASTTKLHEEVFF
jgi:hypothetical protein